jgi:hypothetical protein
MNTIISTSTGTRRSWLIALAVGICILAIPSSASAFYGSNPDSGAAGGGPAPETVSKDSGLVIPDHTSLNASLNDSSQVSAPDRDSGYASLNAVTGGTDPEPTLVSSSSAAGDPFDWGDAALGAGVAMALFTLGAAAVLTVRRRTAVSPTA